MKLFFKHLKNSIKRRPMQPLILILTLALVMVVITSCISVGLFVNGETAEIQKVEYGTADFTVSLNATSKSRFMFEEKVEKVLDGKVNAVGTYELPVFFKQTNQTAFGVAIDFLDVEQIFSFEFSEYLIMTPDVLNESALITRSFANKYNLKLGSSFSVNVLGYDKTYTVTAISETPFMGYYELMVNVTGVMRLLATDSLLVSAIGDSFKPSSTIYVNVLDGYSVNECMSLLKAHTDFSDKTFADVANLLQEESNLKPLNIMVYVLIALSMLLCIAVVFCCFFIISNERTLENALFKAVGASPKKMNFLQYAEIIVYWILGLPLAFILSFPFSKIIYSVVGFNYVSSKFNVLAFALSGILALAVSVFTAFAFIISERRPKKLKKESGLYRYFLPLFVLTFVTTLLAPVKLKFTFTGISLVCLFVAVFTGVPVLFKWINTVIDKFNVKRQIKNNGCQVPSFSYAVKNVKRVSVLQNSCRLLVIILTIIFTILTAVKSSDIVIDNYKTQLNADFAVPNATETCRNKLQELDSAKNVYSFFMGTVIINQENTPIFSVSDVNALSDSCDLTRLPKENEAFISVGLASSRNFKIGDVITVSYGEMKFDLTVAEIREDTFNALIFNSEYFGISHDTLLVDGVDNVNKEKLRNDVVGAVALEMTTVIPCEDVFEKIFVVANLYIDSGWFITPLIILFAFVGMVDNVVISYRARKDEFELYRLSGMSKKSVRRTILFELIITLAFGLVASMICSIFSITLVDQALRTYGYRTLLAFGII